MTRRVAVAIGSILAGCTDPQPVRQPSAGDRLEAAAIARGVIADPASPRLAGLWVRGTDRLCMTPAGPDSVRIGLEVDYGDGQSCTARGVAQRRGSGLRIELEGCRFDARIVDQSIALSARLPEECVRFCHGRATLDAMRVERISESETEAAMAVGVDRRRLCPV